MKFKNILSEGLKDNVERKANVAIRKFKDKNPKCKMKIGLSGDYITVDGKKEINMYQTGQDEIIKKLESLKKKHMSEDILKEDGYPTTTINNARDLQKAINKTKRKPTALPVKVLYGNKKLQVYGALEEDGEFKIYAK